MAGINDSSVFFLKDQIPGIELVTRESNGSEKVSWAKTLEHYLHGDKDYTNDILALIGEDKKAELVSSIKGVVEKFVHNGELAPIGGSSYVKIKVPLIKNRATYYILEMAKDEVPFEKGMVIKSLQKYASQYCILLRPIEERAVCAVYKACDMDSNKVARDTVFEIAYTFFATRLRKIYEAYSTALLKAGAIEDGIIAVLHGFAITLDTYDFDTDKSVGMGPGRLNIPIRTELANILQDVAPFRISSTTWKKIYAYNPAEDGELTRKELSKKFHAAPSTVEMMLNYANCGGVASISKTIAEDDNEDITLGDTIADSNIEDMLFLFELTEILEKVLDDDEREIFSLVLFDELKYSQIAEMLGMQERKVKYLYELAKKKLSSVYGVKYRIKVLSPEEEDEKEERRRRRLAKKEGKTGDCEAAP